METELINQLKELFIPVAEKIGQGAEFGWEIVLRQQIVIGVMGILIGIFGIILAYIVYLVVKKSIKECEKSSYSDWDVVGFMTGTLGSIISGIMIFGGFIDGILHLINPAYYAIEFFINLVK